MKIIIVNDGPGPNLGDQAILQTMKAGIEESFPAAKIQVFFNSGMTDLGDYSRYWKALHNCDLVIFGGGQEIQDHASVAFLISGLLKLLLASLRKKPVFGFALGVGPVKRKISRFLIRKILGKAGFLTVRDDDSELLLKNLGIRAERIRVTADPAFLLEPETGKGVENIFKEENIPMDHHPRIVLALRRWFHYRHYYLPMKYRVKLHQQTDSGDFTAFENMIARFISHLIKNLSARIILLPMRSYKDSGNPGQDDNLVAAEISSRFDENDFVHIIRGSYSPSQIKGLLGKTDLILGMRMHSMIFASMMAVPVLGFNLSCKFRSFFELIDQTDCLVDIEGLNFNSLLASFEKTWRRREEISEQLLRKKPVLQNRARQNFLHLRAEYEAEK